MGDNFTPKNANNYYCKTCDFQCSKQSDWSRHVLTLKHKNGDTMVTNGDNITQQNAKAGLQLLEKTVLTPLIEIF